jgi:hypothetical protein
MVSPGTMWELAGTNLGTDDLSGAERETMLARQALMGEALNALNTGTLTCEHAQWTCLGAGHRFERADLPADVLYVVFEEPGKPTRLQWVQRFDSTGRLCTEADPLADEVMGAAVPLSRVQAAPTPSA